MPLRKLWNSICGKSKPADSTQQSGSVSPITLVPTANTIAGSRPQPTAEPTAELAVATATAVPKPATHTVSREHKKLCGHIESLSAKSVLEIGIDDGRRGLSIVATLTRKGHSTPVHYIAVDQFEMGTNSVSLREFHKQLREFPAKVHLVPMEVNAALDRVVRTYGQVDVILWDQPAPPTAIQSALLGRLSKPTTRLLTVAGGQWTETTGSDPVTTGHKQAA